VHDRDRVINWWIGRLSDQELGEYAELPPRAVGLVLELPYMRAQITGGGRGSRHSRRISHEARNGIGLVAQMRAAGLTLELAVNILDAVPHLSSVSNSVIDFANTSRGIRQLSSVDPQGGWLPNDIVPWHIWERFVLPCREANNPNPFLSDIHYINLNTFPFTDRGTIILPKTEENQIEIELVPFVEKPVYVGEIDPANFYYYWNIFPEDFSCFDDHLLIVDSKWLLHKHPEPSPFKAMQAVLNGQKDRVLSFHVDPIAVIEDDRKTVRAIGQDIVESKHALYRLRNFSSLLDVNMTSALRKMKRRALGLPVDTEPKANFPERYAIASRYPPPVSVFLPAPLAEKGKPEKDD
jgi:hypothetical protein